MSEYLVEVTPGRDLLYRTQGELRAAMHSGVVTADSRIFHRATGRWISITEHPEYRRYQAEISRPPSFDASSSMVEPEEAENPREPQGPPAIRRRSGLLRRLSGLGATSAKERPIAESHHHGFTGWAAIKKWLGSNSTKGTNAPKPIKTSPSSAAPALYQPNQAGPQAPAPPRDDLSFFG